jgi:transcriptional regulator with XRE-family HTH domain
VKERQPVAFRTLSDAQIAKLRVDIGDRLRIARLRAGMAQRTVARHLGIRSHSTISKVERGAQGLTIEELVAFARLYRQRVAFFFEPFDEA